jgi:integrase
VVTLNGRDCYLGEFGSPESYEKYHRLLGEWRANGCRLLPSEPTEGLAVAHVVDAFLEHAKVYYRHPDGRPTTEVQSFRQVINPLLDLYGTLPAGEFDSLCLQALREHMIHRLKWSRVYINNQINRVRHIFRWGLSRKLVPETVIVSLSSVAGLKPWRSQARETSEVKPVSSEFVKALRPFVSKQVWAMICLQWLTGARAGEIVTLRLSDIKASGTIWRAELEHHKTSHHQQARTIFFGPKAQKVLKPFMLNRALHAFLFSPAEAEAYRRQEITRRRKTPLSCGNRPGTNRSAHPFRAPRDRFDVASYRRAIARACDRAFPLPPELARARVKGEKHTRFESMTEWRTRVGAGGLAAIKDWRLIHRWHPHQLRHSAATRFRKRYGIEVAQLLLGHRLGSKITEVYAQENRQKLCRVLAKCG